MSILSNKAEDINVSDEELCLILGYLSSPGRIGLIEAQIPTNKVNGFEREFPSEPYYPITQGTTSGGHVKKQGYQFRIYFNNIDNCPVVLVPFLGEGNAAYIKRINKSKFVEKIIENYGFSFGETQNVDLIRTAVLNRHPRYIDQFETGLLL